MKVCFISLTPILAFSLTNDLSAFNLPRLPSFNVGVMSQSNVQASQEGGFSNPANFKVPKQPEKPEEPTIPQNFQEIDLMDQLARRFNSIVSMAYLTVTTNFSRQEFEQRIKRYGCHCFPSSKKEEKNGGKERHAANGSGPPVDAIDSVCQKLSKCHRCIKIEFRGEIDVNDGRYSWTYDSVNNKFDCSKNRKNPARKALCECDSNFALEMGKTWNDANYNLKFWLNNRNVREQGTNIFDFEATCLTLANLGKNMPRVDRNVNTCCGHSYTAKHSFVPYNSSVKNCCEISGKVYDPGFFECCHDGAIKSIGSC